MPFIQLLLFYPVVRLFADILQYTTVLPHIAVDCKSCILMLFTVIYQLLFMSLIPAASVQPLTVAHWKLTNRHYQRQHLLLQETLLSLATGYIGSRGTLEVGAPEGVASCE